MNQIKQILNKAFKKDRLNILTCPTHERYESNLCKTGHNFFAVRTPQVKDWNTVYASLPSNYTLLNRNKPPIEQIPQDIQIDLVFSQNKFGQFQILEQLAKHLNIPLVTIEHTLAYPNWPKEYLQHLKTLKGKVNVFISEYSRGIWGWQPNEADVIHHGIDTATFRPSDVTKLPHILSVCNDWINRDAPCGFKLWQKVTEGLPVKVVGATPGLSEPAKSVEELAGFYRESALFLNTSLLSPIPTSLLEAMSCGTCCVSTNNCMIPEIIKHGENGFLGNSPEELRQLCLDLLGQPELRYRVGQNARRTIEERFSLGQFVSKWDELFWRAYDKR